MKTEKMLYFHLGWLGRKLSLWLGKCVPASWSLLDTAIAGLCLLLFNPHVTLMYGSWGRCLLSLSSLTELCLKPGRTLIGGASPGQSEIRQPHFSSQFPADLLVTPGISLSVCKTE